MCSTCGSVIELTALGVARPGNSEFAAAIVDGRGSVAYAPHPSSRSSSVTASAGTSPAVNAWPIPRASTNCQRPIAHFLVAPHVADQRRGGEAPVQHAQLRRHARPRRHATTSVRVLRGTVPEPRRQPERQAQPDGDALTVQQSAM